MLENLDLVLLAMDETVDGGCGPGHCQALSAPACSTMRTALTACASMEGWLYAASKVSNWAPLQHLVDRSVPTHQQAVG